MGQPHISPLMCRGHRTSSQASAPTAHSANPTFGHVQTPLLPPVQASDQGTIQTPQHHPAGLLCSSKLGLVAQACTFPATSPLSTATMLLWNGSTSHRPSEGKMYTRFYIHLTKLPSKSSRRRKDLVPHSCASETSDTALK